MSAASHRKLPFGVKCECVIRIVRSVHIRGLVHSLPLRSSLTNCLSTSTRSYIDSSLHSLWHVWHWYDREIGPGGSGSRYGTDRSMLSTVALSEKLDVICWYPVTLMLPPDMNRSTMGSVAADGSTTISRML